MESAEGFDITRYNEAIKAWGRETGQQLQGSINALPVRSTGALIRSLNVRFGQRYGQTNYIGFRFARYGVWIEKGASRGYGGAKGSQWRTSTGQKRRTNPASMGRMGTGNRAQRPWFNRVVEPGLERLGDIVAEHIADAAVKGILIK